MKYTLSRCFNYEPDENIAFSPWAGGNENRRSGLTSGGQKMAKPGKIKALQGISGAIGLTGDPDR
jgi:hypothetical protein